MKINIELEAPVEGATVALCVIVWRLPGSATSTGKGVITRSMVSYWPESGVVAEGAYRSAELAIQQHRETVDKAGAS